MRTRLVQNTPAVAAATTTGSGASVASSPKPAVIAAPAIPNPSRNGTRCRIGPPASHMQVSQAARAESISGGQCSHSLTATMAATASAARRPSPMLTARGLKAMAEGRPAEARLRELVFLTGHFIFGSDFLLAGSVEGRGGGWFARAVLPRRIGSWPDDLIGRSLGHRPALAAAAAQQQRQR